jgi:hypothetical protein
MSMTPKAIQDLLDELESSKQSRLRAWEVLQKLRATLSDLGNVAIGPPPRKTFEAEGAILERSLAKCLRDRNEILKSLLNAVCRFKDAAMIQEKKPDFPSAHQALLKELNRAEELLRY